MQDTERTIPLKKRDNDNSDNIERGSIERVWGSGQDQTAENHSLSPTLLLFIYETLEHKYSLLVTCSVCFGSQRQYVGYLGTAYFGPLTPG